VHLGAHERVTSHTPVIQDVPYGADMRPFILFGGMPCVLYGAGDVGLAHGPDEHFRIRELLTAAKTIACRLIGAAWRGSPVPGSRRARCGGDHRRFGFSPSSTKDQPLAETSFALRADPSERLPNTGSAATLDPYVADKGLEGEENHRRCTVP
jgi:hypothetical protein